MQMCRAWIAFSLVALLGAALAGCGGGGGGRSTGRIIGFVYEVPGTDTLTLDHQDNVPLAGVTVAVAGTSLQTTTLEDGSFRLDKVPAGVRTVTMAKAGYPTLTVQVTILAGKTVSLNQGGTPVVVGDIEGRVLAGGNPLRDVEIRVQGYAITARTDETGQYRLSNVPVGAQTVIASKAGYAAASVTVTVTKGATAHAPDLTLTAATRKWTVLVFMNADNDLEEYGIEDMNEMESVAQSDDVAILVQVDRVPGRDGTNGNWTGTRRYLIQHDNDFATITSPMLEEMGEIDMGDPAVLRDFIAWGQELYPAEHYLVVIWNHGAGWRTATTVGQTRGVSYDDTSGNHIRTIELPDALQAPQPLDIVAFDASLMQMIEVAYEMRGTCRYIVGSEESPPGPGYPYHLWVGPLAQNPQMSARTLADTMAQSTVDFYGTNSDITHSVLDPSELPALATAVDNFAGTMIGVAGSFPTQFADARDQADSYAYYENKDLYHYAELVKAKVNNAGVRAAADGVMAAVDRAVLANYHADYHPNSHGIAIFVPTPTGYNRVASTYLPLAFAKATRWNEWLAAQKQ